MTIGQRLRLAIARSGLTQKEVARRAGLNQITVSDVLNDRRRPSFETVERMVIAIGATFGKIFDEPRVALSAEDAILIRDFRDLLNRLLAEDATPTKPKTQPRSTRARRPKRVEGNHEVRNLPDEPIPEWHYRMGARRAFAVLTDTMIGAGILEGSVIYVRPTIDLKTADGRIILCALNGTWYLKRLHVRARRKVLESENPRHPTLVVTDDDDFRLIGIVVGLQDE
jgi:transcriptional regulator with XRE-family HTH domain